ncbi:MAG: hypothetical protein ACRD0N_10485 [Acidimicrobiales bacterium]
MLRSRARRACALAALCAVLATACGDDGDDAPATGPPSTTASTTTTTTGGSAASPTTSTTEAVQVIEVTFAAGQVTGGVRRHEVRLGEKVRLRVTSDVADEVHVHTYDVTGAVGPRQPAELELTATIPGQHEVELEDKGRPLLVLVVQ